MELKGKKVLVTGGAGFIGSHLVDRLIASGAKVSIIDNFSTGQKKNIHPSAKFYHLDMNDSSVLKIFQEEKPEFVYHLAFNTDVPQSVRDPLFDAQGISGSINVFLAAVKVGAKKVVMASSAFVYGNCEPSSLPVTEQHQAQPVSPYAISKIASENYLRYFHNAHNLPIVIFRYSTVYGPRQITGALADYIRKISEDKQADMFGDGNLTRDYIHVDDVVRANLLALDVPNNHPEPIFNLGSTRERTLNEVYGTVAKLLGKPENKPKYLPARSGDITRFSVSYEKARHQLGWEPTVSFEKGVEDLLKDKQD